MRYFSLRFRLSFLRSFIGDPGVVFVPLRFRRHPRMSLSGIQVFLLTLTLSRSQHLDPGSKALPERRSRKQYRNDAMLVVTGRSSVC
jgi:hypothetical protein